MKLRVRGDSLRLRLGQGEVARFAAEGALAEATGFGPGSELVVALAFGDRLGATFEGSRITVAVPAELARRWAASDDVGLEGTQSIGDGRALRILVEKDYACLKPRAEEDETDAYPHPKAGTGEDC